jgi:hypothetical protein
MNRFTIIVMTDSRDDNDAVVQAVSALGADKDAEQQAAIAHFAADRDRAVAEAVESERVSMRKRVHSLKLGPVKVGPGEMKNIRVESRFPFHAACLKISAENVHRFCVNDLSFVKASDLTGREDSYKASNNPVPAALFSDEGTAILDLDVECRAVKISISNIGKKAHTFRGQIVGFRSDATVPRDQVASYSGHPAAEAYPERSPSGFSGQWPTPRSGL